MQKQTGFTLIEILIALAVIAIALTAIVKASSADIVDATYLQEKSIAHWVGMNALTSIQLGLKSASENNEVQMLGQSWYWSAKLMTTPDPYVEKIIVTVREVPHKSPLIVIEGFQEVRPS